MKKYFKILFLFAYTGIAVSCADYLDIVPDNVATMDNAFTNRINAERFLFGCYNYLPNPTDAFGNPGLIGGDEIWWNIDRPAYQDYDGARLAKGFQNTNDPYYNFWDGGHAGKNLFTAIRDCNIFLENIHTPPDLEVAERARWIAEVKFLKAYYHFYLMHLYGPIPIIRENLPISATPDEVRVYREPIDEVANYIVELLDEAVKDLPMDVYAKSVEEAGRITKPIALAVKAKTLVWAASPLFNGNTDYVNFKDNRGKELVPATYDATKWQRAADAIKNAIDTCRLAGHVLYQYKPATQMSDVTKLKYTLRGAVTDNFNPEIVWASTHNIQTLNLQRWCMARLGTTYTDLGVITELCTTLKIAEQYYTNNGLPIDEDPEWLAWLGGSLGNRYETLVCNGNTGSDHQYYIRTGERTAKLNYYREPRFYAYLGFDRGIFEGHGQIEANSYYLQARATEPNGYVQMGAHIPTGYYIKKLVNTATLQSGTSYSEARYLYPIIRLTDLFLLYAEALNEANGPGQEVYQWIDTVRVRAGLPGVEEAWAKSILPSKPRTKEGLREIIKRERLIDLAFEGQRSGDLRRWKDALNYFNEPVQGWNYQGMIADTYYKVTTYYERVFSSREYLWPIKSETLTINSNLVQNPGWK
jgi:hypothetical protein